MAIQIGNYNFEGPFQQTSSLRAQSGVYTILGRTRGSNWNVVDIGESGDVRYRVENHDRKGCWSRQGHGELAVAALYTGQVQRMAIENQLRRQYNPPCGRR